MADSTTATAILQTPESEQHHVTARTKWSYGIGCIGRDAAYSFVNNFILTFLTLGIGLSNWQLGAIGVVMVVARIWDAVNDPMMGTIIDNTNTRFGKFKPYIITGAVLNSVFVVLLFNVHPANEVLFVVVFAVTYILWGMTYTMNDISYWGMLPSLTVNRKDRESVTSLARIGANIGLFLVTALVPVLTAGRMSTMYPALSYAIAALFIACQVLVIFGVQENKSAIVSAKNHHGLKDTVRIIFKNDQLLAIISAILLFNIGYFTTTMFGIQFFYFDYGHYGGMEFTFFAITIGVAQILTLALYPAFSKKLTRPKLFGIATVMVLIGYAGLMAVGYVLPMNMVLICFVGLILFAGQAIVQLLNYVLLADTVEYGQWKLGTRNESVVFSLNPFVTKLASAVAAGIFSLTMIVSGLNPFSQRISEVERNTALTKNQVLEQGNAIVAEIPRWSKLTLRLSMIVVPLILIVLCYVVYRKKYKIDDKMYDQIIHDLEDRAKTETAPAGTQE